MRLLLIILVFLLAMPAQAGGLVVIASPQVPVDTISVSDMAAIYTLKKTSWSNNIPMVPVNREANSPAREKFSEAVFNLSPQELVEYWNQLRFKGKLPLWCRHRTRPYWVLYATFPVRLVILMPPRPQPASRF